MEYRRSMGFPGSGISGILAFPGYRRSRASLGSGISGIAAFPRISCWEFSVEIRAAPKDPRVSPSSSWKTPSESGKRWEKLGKIGKTGMGPGDSQPAPAEFLEFPAVTVGPELRGGSPERSSLAPESVGLQGRRRNPGKRDQDPLQAWERRERRDVGYRDVGYQDVGWGCCDFPISDPSIPDPPHSHFPIPIVPPPFPFSHPHSCFSHPIPIFPTPFPSFLTLLILIPIPAAPPGSSPAWNSPSGIPELLLLLLPAGNLLHLGGKNTEKSRENPRKIPILEDLGLFFIPEFRECPPWLVGSGTTPGPPELSAPSQPPASPAPGKIPRNSRKETGNGEKSLRIPGRRPEMGKNPLEFQEGERERGKNPL